jgi:hypothetical protein
MQVRRMQIKSVCVWGGGGGWQIVSTSKTSRQPIKKVREEKVRDLPNNKCIFRGEGWDNEPILYLYPTSLRENFTTCHVLLSTGTYNCNIWIYIPFFDTS